VDVVAAHYKPDFLGGGAMAGLMRSRDWSGSPLGDPADWPQSLRSVVGLMLPSKFPMFLAWGPELRFLYNDAYLEVLGAKHPEALDCPFQVLWSEAWDDVKPFVDRTLAGEATYHENLPLTLRRHGYDEACWFTFSYSPVRNESGAVAGLFCAVTETTRQVLVERGTGAENDRLRRLFDQAPGFMAVVREPNHRFELANAAFLRLTGHREILGKPIIEALPEVKGQGFIELLDQAYVSGKPFVGRQMQVSLQRLPHGPAETRFVDFVFQPILDDAQGGTQSGAQNKVSGVFIQGSDVTEAYRAQQDLRESTAWLRGIAETMPGSLWTADAEGRINHSSQAWFNYSGMQPHATNGDHWMEFVHPDDRARVAAVWGACVKSGEPYDIEFRLRRQDGMYRWFLVRAIARLGEDGGISSWTGINVDIDGQKCAESGLKQLNETLEQRVAESMRQLIASQIEMRTIYDHSTEYHALMTALPDGRFIYDEVNPAVLRLYGKTREQVIGRGTEDIFGADAAALNRHLARCLATKGPYQYTRKIGGSVVEAIGTVVPRPAGDDRLRLVVSARDVTDSRRLEEQLRQAQKMEAVGQLTGGLAHDFNNLLAGITGSLELIEARIAQGRVNDLARYVAAAASSASRAAALTHRLLAFSRRQTLDPKPVDVKRLATGMEELIQRTAGPAIRVETVMSGGLWTTLCDPHQLENVLLNLAINARDAMPDGGRLTIEAANTRLDEAAAGPLDVAPGQYVAICVTDTGSGMPADVAARAFEPFFTTKPIGEGTGLGLSMVYGFARQSDGHVGIYSEIGHGTTVRLYLPRHRDGVEHGAEAGPLMVAAPSKLPAGRVVLVVDDEPVVRMLVAEVLRELGCTVLEAADGPEGLRLLRSQRVDLLITDVGLPNGMNGRQLADAARVLRRDLRVLFITGYAENAVVSNGYLEPGMQVMTKPFAMDALAAKIRGLFEAPVLAS
jgi:PAS domain S-box-containing protein